MVTYLILLGIECEIPLLLLEDADLKHISDFSA